MTQKREGESGDSPSLCHHSEPPSGGFLMLISRTQNLLSSYKDRVIKFGIILSKDCT